MGTKRKIMAFGLIVIFVIGGWFWLRKEIRIDSCLDLGGRWNYETKSCDKTTKGTE